MSLPYQPVTSGAGNYTGKIFMVLWALTITFMSCRNPKPEPAEHPAYADSIIAHADGLREKGDFRPSIGYLDSAYRNFPHAGPIDRWKKYQFIAKYCLSDQPDTAKARSYADSMLLVLKGHEQQYKEAYAQTLFAQGDVLMAKKKYQGAFNLYYDGRSYALKNLDTCGLAPFTERLAMIKYRQMQFREAIPYFRKALDENSHCRKRGSFDDSFSLPQNSLNTLALCYEQLRMKDSALFYLKKALALTELEKPRFPEKTIEIGIARGTIAGNLGDIYQMLNQRDSARYYLQECIRINDRPGYNTAMAGIAKINLVFMDLRLHKTQPLTGILSQSEQGLKSVKCNEIDKILLMEYWYGIKRDYYKSIHHMDSAFFYQKKLYDYSDSLRSAERDLRQADMESVFAARTQSYRFSLLDRDNQIKRNSLLLTILSGLLVLIVLIVVWNNLKRSGKYIAGLTSLNRKVTEQNVQMQHALSALEQSQADNTRMMKIVAHDLRNPIGAIRMAASLITRKFADLEEDHKTLDIIIRSADSALQLVSELLHAQTNVGELKKEQVDLEAILQYCADLLEHKAKAKGQHIKLNITPLTLYGSREKLWRVVSNLIANAIKFSPHGAVIVVSMEKHGEYARIAVQDHGIGIPEGMKDKLFDLFTEAKRPGTAGEQPFGLGLAISKQIVEAHGGRIWFESTPGNGTTFFVELPL